MLQMLTVKSKNLNATSAGEIQERINASLKEAELGPFDAVPKLFNSAEYHKLSLDDKLNFYFIDPSLMPLFIQVSRGLVCMNMGRFLTAHHYDTGELPPLSTAEGAKRES